MFTNNPIKLMKIVFEEPIQIGDVLMREYQVSDHTLAKHDAHLHGNLQCVALLDPYSDSTIFVPLRYVRTMEAADKHNIYSSSSSSSDGILAMQKQMREQLAFKVPSEAPSEAPRGCTRGH